MDELIFMREDGDNGLELTSADDPWAVAYIRADCTEGVTITKKQNFFVDGAENNGDTVSPCNTCKHNGGDLFDYPCAACVHG